MPTTHDDDNDRDELVEHLDALVHQADVPERARTVEAILEILYADAEQQGDASLRALSTRLCTHTGTSARLISAAWYQLIELRLDPDCTDCTRLDAALAQAPARSRWLINAESARLIYDREGPRAAWQRLLAHPPVPAEKAWQDQGPMVIHAVLVGLHLAAATGRWQDHATLLDQARQRFADPRDPTALRAEILAADHAIRRGYYRDAIRALNGLDCAVRGDIRLALLGVRLHALVACSSSFQHERVNRPDDTPRTPELVTAIKDTIKAFDAELDTRRAAGQRAELGPVAGNEHDEYSLPERERAEIEARYRALKRQARLDQTDPSDDDSEAMGLAALLAQEHLIRFAYRQAKHSKREAKRHSQLRDLLGKTEGFIDRGDKLSEEELIMLRLLWCRLVVDAGDVKRFTECEELLGDAIEDADELGLVRLQMAGLDQRAVLYFHEKWPRDWRRATHDAGRAGTMALQLIAQNSEQPGSQPDELEKQPDSSDVRESSTARALLRSLFPVLDRIIEFLAVGALGIKLEADRNCIGWSRKRKQQWIRFGQAIHDYAEQSQRLALEEARRAYHTGETRPHRFALVSLSDSEHGHVDPIAAVQRSLPRREVILQYFVVSKYIIIFVLGRRLFNWTVTTMAPDDAHDGLNRLLEICQPWLMPDDKNSPCQANYARLRDILLPPAIKSILARARPRHLRLVPHDVLYRVPFGRLQLGKRTVVEQMTLSLHATAALAAESARHRGHDDRPTSLARLGHVIGPDMWRATCEHTAMAGAMGSPALAQPVLLDTRGGKTEQFEQAKKHCLHATGRTTGVSPKLVTCPRLQASAGHDPERFKKAIKQVIEHMDLLHFTCHGVKKDNRVPASMTLGPDRPGAETKLGLDDIAQMKLNRCRLVVLQSCWTGWQEHERENPVQGFPQAMCDAGAGAVIAPLRSVPTALTPVFTEVFYRVLGYLPAERALGKALTMLRRHGEALVAGDCEAMQQLRDIGSIDALDYRYTGHTDIDLTGGLRSRLWARISVRLWLRSMLRRRQKAMLGPDTADQPARALPPRGPIDTQ